VFRPQRHAASYWKRHHEAKLAETKEGMIEEILIKTMDYAEA
jgi:hypothetical protein